MCQALCWALSHFLVLTTTEQSKYYFPQALAWIPFPLPPKKQTVRQGFKVQVAYLGENHRKHSEGVEKPVRERKKILMNRLSLWVSSHWGPSEGLCRT